MQKNSISRTWFSPAVFAFIGLFFVFMLVGQSNLLKDPGTYWHVTFGKKMFAEGTLITSDQWSYRTEGDAWLPMAWGTEIGYGILYDLGGFDTLLLSTVVIIALLYSWIFSRITRAGAKPIMALLVLAVGMSACSFHFHTRPHMISLLFFAVTYALLIDIDQKRKPAKALWFLIPVYIIWTNSHAGVLSGLLTISLAMFGWAVTGFFKRESVIDSKASFAKATLFVVAIYATILVNPYGLKLQQTWFALIGSKVLPKVIQEHGPLSLSPDQPEGFLVLFLALIYVSCLISARSKKMPITWFIPLVWLVMGIKSIRHGTFFSLAALLCIADMLPKARWNAWLEKQGSELFIVKEKAEDPEFNWKAIIIPAILVVTTLGLQLSNTTAPIFGRNWASPHPEVAPLELMDELKVIEGSSETPVPVINDMLYGGYLIMFHPNLRVFIDDRCALYKDQRLEEYFVAATKSPEVIDQWVEKYKANYALLENEKRMKSYCESSDEWELIKSTEEASLFKRVDKLKPASEKNKNE